MSGIMKIQQRRDELKNPKTEETKHTEVWLKDGEQLFCTSVASGADDDKLVDELWMYTFRIGNRFRSLLQDSSVDATGVPEDTRASHRFGLWVYAHYIFHVDKRNDEWEEVETPSGVKMFKEVIDDYRIVQLAFGRGDYVWNQLVEIYGDWGSLNKGVIRVKRNGIGLDTSYAIMATTKKEKIPAARKAEASDLQTIKEYNLERYGKPLTEEDMDMMTIHNTANGHSSEETTY